MRGMRGKTSSLSRRILKERTKKEEAEAAAEKKDKQSVDLKNLERRQPPRPVTTLSKHEYAQHRKARDLMTAAVGQSCERLHLKLIDMDEFKRVQTEAAKRAIRETNLYVARRAWQDLMIFLLEVPGRNVNGIPVKFQPMVDYWHEVWGCMPMKVDAQFDPPKEEKPKKVRKPRVRKIVKKEDTDESEASEEEKG